MRATKLPAEIHTAFNPVLAVFEKESGDSQEAKISVKMFNISSTDRIERDYINNSAQFDLKQSLIRSFPDKVNTLISGVVFDDLNLISRYHIMNTELNVQVGGNFYAVNAVSQIGESSDLRSKRGYFLTSFERVKFYEGYPQTLAAMGFAGGSHVRFEDETQTSLINAVLFTIQLKPGKRYVAISSELGFDPLADNSDVIITDNQGEIIYVATADGEHEERRMIIENPCVPKNPFYVRWINQQGGWDYWMFSFRQYVSRNVENIQTFEPAIFNQETAKAFIEEFYKEGIEKITIGADGLNENEYEAVSRIIYSPNIQYYDVNTGKWFKLLIDSGENENDTYSSAKSVEFTFLLPKPQIQF